MRKYLFGAVLCLLTFSVNASVVYGYEGNPFDVFSFDFPSGSDRISGSLSLSNELAANLDWVNASPDSWTFTDGLTTVTNQTSGYVSTFQFSTDAAGGITDWRILLLRPIGSLGLPSIEIRTRTDSGNPVNIYDESTYCVELTIGNTCANGTNAYSSSAGVWSVSAVPVPSAVWLFGSGLIGLIGLARRKA